MSIELIQKVRKATGVSLTQAKTALDQSGNNAEVAIELLNSQKVLRENVEKADPVYPKEKPFWKFWK